MKLNSMVSSSFRFSLALAISVQIALGSVPIRSYAAPNSDSDDISSGIGQAAVTNREALLAAEKAGQAIAAGDFDSVDFDKDIFHVAGGLSPEGQVIRITDGQSYSLNRPQSEIPPVSFTALKVRFDKPSQSLIFEAYIGQNNNGEGGKLVATHTIPNLDIKALIRDEEILQFIDSNGRLNAIAMDIVASSIFKAPIPIIKNLWTDRSGNPAQSTYSLKFASHGTQPPPTLEGMIVPLDEKGNPKISAGDLIITKNDATLGIFSRQVTYNFIADGLKAFVKLGALIYPANMAPGRLQALAKDLTQIESVESLEEAPETTPTLVRDALLHFNEKRMQAIDASRGLQGDRASRQFQRLDDLGQWQSIYDRIVKKAESLDTELRAKLGQKPKNVDMQKQSDMIKASLRSGDFSENWRELYPTKTVNPFKLMVREYAVPVGFVAITLASFGFVGAYEASQTMRDIQAFSWLYQHIPDVVRDDAYRHPLLLGTLSVLAAWPAGEIAAASFARGIKFLAEKTRNMNTRMSRRIQDMARVWGKMGRWQVLTTTGTRIRSVTTSPIPRAIISNVLGQRSMITAWNNNLSPFQIVKPSSAVGQKLGITKPMFLGAGAPSQNELRLKAQALITEKRDRANSLALQIATLVVGEDENIDPASIMMLLQGDVDLTKLDSIFSNPSLNRVHKLTQEKMATYLAAIDNGFFDGDITSDSTKLNEYITLAKYFAGQIKSKPKALQIVQAGWLKTRGYLKGARNFVLNLGYADSLFLRKIVTNKFVSEQTKRAFIPDHIMVAVIYALYGDRANLNKPKDLAADPNGALWTSSPHWSDVGSNTNAHWFSAAARKALIYQQVKPRNSDIYEPFEYALLNSADRIEPFRKSFLNWFRVLDPRQSDIGTTAFRSFKKSMTTLQAAWITNMVFRMGLGHQSMSDATAGFLLMTFASQWTYGFPWDYIERGNFIEEERIEGMKMKFRQAMATISESAHEADPATAAAKARHGYNAIMELFKQYNPDAISKVHSNATFEDFFGLAAKLHMAITTGDAELIEKTKQELRTTLVNGGVGVPELEVMNAQAIYDYALQMTPIYTEAHWSTAWVSTTLFGAILTTLLAIPLSVASFHPEWSKVSMWMVGSTLAYIAYYKALKADGWLAKGLDKLPVGLGGKPAPTPAKAQAEGDSATTRLERPPQQSNMLQGYEALCESYLTGAKLNKPIQ